MRMTTIKDVYDLVDEKTDRIYQRIDRVECRVSALELFKAEMMGKLTVIVGVISLSFTMAWDWLKKRI